MSSAPWPGSRRAFGARAEKRRRRKARREDRERGTGSGNRAANWAVAGSGIQMGKTALCADAAGPGCRWRGRR